MSIRDQLIQILADGQFHSGEALALALGVTRAAIWKNIKQIQHDYRLELYAVRGRGYRLANPMELLDLSRILAYLPPQSAAQLGKIEIQSVVDSTNNRMMEQLGRGLEAPHVLLAEYQEAGKGRRGRHWVSAYGKGLLMSLLWRFDSAAELSGLALVVAMAVVDVLKSLGINGVGIKWPNDVLWQDKKLSGILLELQGETGGPCQVVLGIGMNVDRSTDGQADMIDQPWIDITSITGRQVSRNQLAGLLLDRLVVALDRFQQQGLSDFLPQWRLLDILCGQSVILSLGDRQIEGIAQGINSDGAILLQTPAGVKHFLAGDVSIRTSNL